MLVVASVVIPLAVILVAAKLGGHFALLIDQPAVLGELLVGVILGNAYLVGIPWFHTYADNPAIEVLAQLGVLILLFEVGLESTVRDMMRVGFSSLLVAVLGVIAPFALGWMVAALVLPEHGPYAHAFV